jgi:hypothetical protein
MEPTSQRVEVPTFLERLELGDDITSRRKCVLELEGRTVLLAHKCESLLHMGIISKDGESAESYLFTGLFCCAGDLFLREPVRHFYQDLKSLYVGRSIGALRLEAQR